MADEPKTGWSGLLFVFGLALAALVEAVRLALGHTEDLRSVKTRYFFILGCLILAYMFEVFKDEFSVKKVLGGIQIILAVLVMWYQITKLGQTGWDKSGVIDRCVFLLGSVALLGKGMKDFFADEWNDGTK